MIYAFNDKQGKRKLKKVIISVLGNDRPGILAAVSHVLLEQDCNIENISQTILQSVFGALLIVSAPEHLKEDALRMKLLEGTASLGLDIFVKEYESEDDKPPESQPFVVTTFGPDKQGLVESITNVFARFNINITNLKAIFKGGDDPKKNIMIFEVDIPENVNLTELQKDLDESGKKLCLDINIQHRKIFENMNRI